MTPSDKMIWSNMTWDHGEHLFCCQQSRTKQKYHGDSSCRYFASPSMTSIKLLDHSDFHFSSVNVWCFAQENCGSGCPQTWNQVIGKSWSIRHPIQILIYLVSTKSSSGKRCPFGGINKEPLFGAIVPVVQSKWQ